MGPEGLIFFVGRDVTKQDLLERERQETAAARDAVEQVGDIGHWRAVAISSCNARRALRVSWNSIRRSPPWC